MSIPNEITADHIRQAIAELRAGVEHGFGKSLGYDVFYEGERFPPKAVIGLAAQRAIGKEISHRDFSGGEAPGATNPLLRSLGFQIVDKSGKTITGPSAGPKSESDRVWERLTFGHDAPTVEMKYMGVSFEVEVVADGRHVLVNDQLREAHARVDEATLLQHLDAEWAKKWAETKVEIQQLDRVTLWRCGTALIPLKNPKRKTVNLNPYKEFRFNMQSLLRCLSTEDAKTVGSEDRDLSVHELAEALGVNARTSAEPLGLLLQQLLEQYGKYTPGDGFGGEHPLWELKEQVEQALREQPAIKARPNLRLAFAGKGRLARDLWVSVLDTRVTTSVRRGHYVVYLFKRDLSGVYLTMNQGVTDVFNDNTSADARAVLEQRAEAFRKRIPNLKDAGFVLDGQIDLAPDEWGKKYESSTIAHKLYKTDAMPDESILVADLEAVLEAYDVLIARETRPPAWWIFQSTPNDDRLRDKLATTEPPTTWPVKQHAKEIRPGDRVFLWESGGTGILALATVRGEPEKTEKVDGPQLRVPIDVDQVVSSPITPQTVRAAEGLDDLTILHEPEGTNFRVTAEQADVLLALVFPPARLEQACAAFSRALRTARLSFGVNHDDFVRSFLASLVTKPLVILTGLSGSGKTQIALKLGQWLGGGRHKVVPVRPDWTGPESLLGYENALAPAQGGRSPWHVPAALRFMLQARSGAGVPHLLLLDEMNLAHVERYFADVLSGMESRQPCLPNLRHIDGAWLMDRDAGWVAVPRNLFMVGTVNVDETTYMFSPKVLDRANTIEFRVTTDDLPSDLESMAPPEDVEPADPPLAKVLLDVATDHQWHTDSERQPTWLEDFAGHLRELHRLLSPHGFEFGHRVFNEAVRFAVIYAAMDTDSDADETLWAALDLQLMQKILPRVHGARRRLEPLLRELGAYAMHGEPIAEAAAFDPVKTHDEAPRLPRAFEKIRRMTVNVRANQFASFAE